jgi:hypothetical protein
MVVEQLNAQVKPENRYPSQIYFEDSLRVFWTWYPNPFSPSTSNQIYRSYGQFTFYCDLSDTVIVAFVESKSDSIVYKTIVKTANGPHFALCYWTAKPEIDPSILPLHHFRSESDQELRLLLIVQDRSKARREIGVKISKGWYCGVGDPSNEK